MTTIATHNPVRSDVSVADSLLAPRTPHRGWALAGIGAGLAGIATIVTTSAVDAVYDSSLVRSRPASGAAEALSSGGSSNGSSYGGPHGAQGGGVGGHPVEAAELVRLQPPQGVVVVPRDGRRPDDLGEEQT